MQSAQLLVGKAGDAYGSHSALRVNTLDAYLLETFHGIIHVYRYLLLMGLF
jgi:hypothetical protein